MLSLLDWAIFIPGEGLMRRLLVSAALAVSIVAMPFAAVEAAEQAATKCYYTYNPFAGNFLVVQQTTNKRTGETKTHSYSTERPPRNCQQSVEFVFFFFFDPRFCQVN